MAEQELIVKKLEMLEGIAAKYDDVIGSIADGIKGDTCDISAKELGEHFQQMAQEGRLLTIGFVGRVKAGKSSLQNALFFGGKDVLPKAATPMTASLTIMQRGEAFKAAVDCYTAEDAAVIKRKHDRYELDRQDVEAEVRAAQEKAAKRAGKPVNEDAIRRQTDAKMKDNPNVAMYDHYERMKKASGTPPSGKQVIEASSADDLMGRLADYVGADGSRMPWTKSVELTLPDFPENIRVVDTPGIDDPMPSREERTRAFLHECDVVFIISPAGEFLNAQDITLMGKISGKGVEQMYLVASQADNNLFCNPQEPGYGDLDRRLEVIKEKLYEQAKDNLKHINEEVEPKHQFDKLVQDGESRLALTSAICHTMNLRLRDKGSWNDGMNKVWENLQEHYRDYFDSNSAAEVNLAKLANIDAVEKWIKDAQADKDRIMEEKRQKEVGKYKDGIDAFGKGLLKETNEKIATLKNTDAATLQKKKRDLEKTMKKGRQAVNDAFEECVDRLKNEVSNLIDTKTKALFEGARTEVKGARHTNTEIVYETGYEHSFLWFQWGSYCRPHSEEYTAVNAGTLAGEVNDYMMQLQDTIENAVNETKASWRKTVQSEVTRALREAVDDDDAIDLTSLKSCINGLLRREFNAPDIDLGDGILSTAARELRDEDAEAFLAEVSGYISNKRNAFLEAKRNFLRSLDSLTQGINAADSLFDSMKEALNGLEAELANKAAAIARLEQCEKELKEAV